MKLGSDRKGLALRVLVFLSLGVLLLAHPSEAKTAKEIDLGVDQALERFQKEVFGSSDIVKKAKAVLVFPKVMKGGIGLGGEYGEGALRVGGKTVEYYNIIGGSFGWQLGFQVKTVYLFFMEEFALTKFRGSDGWQAGIDGSVALIKVGADASIDTTKTDEPMVAFVLGQKGLMYNLTLEGSKFNKITK
jgi:lipid-binding SYLF domain-containing protein